MRLNATEKNVLEAVEYLMWASKVKVSSIGLKDDLVLHPDFPSMVSISDALSEWRVSNLATRLSIEQLKEIPLPAVAYLNIRGGLFAPIKSVDGDTVEWLDTHGGWQKDSASVFGQKWNGVTLLVEPNSQSGEINYPQRKKEQFLNNARVPFLIIGTLCCLVLVIAPNWQAVQASGLFTILTFGIKFMGMTVGGLLLWQSMDSDNPFLQNICHLSSKNNCNHILQSRATKITTWLSWADVGFVYFSGGLIAVIFSLFAGYQPVIGWVLILSLLSLPYTFYSVWYQRFVAKEWCTLCMAAQVLIWLEVLVGILNFREYKFIWNEDFLLLLFLGFLIPTLIWTLLKRPLIQSSRLFSLQREFRRVKFDENYIKSTFSNQKTMPPIFEDMQTVRLGDDDAERVLTVVTNPLCGPCSKIHGEIDTLISENPKFRCQFVFLAPSIGLRIASRFMDSDSRDRKALMLSWYKDVKQDPVKWLGLHQVSGLNGDQFRIHSRWCELAGITGTPTIFIDGLMLPRAFKIKELKGITAVSAQFSEQLTSM